MYNKDEIRQIRSIPTRDSDKDFKDSEKRENYFKNKLINELDGVFHTNADIDGELPILGLFQFEGSIIASGIINSITKDDKKGSIKHFHLDCSSIKYFEDNPITTAELINEKIEKFTVALSIYEPFRQFSQPSLIFNRECFDKINKLILSRYYDKYDFLSESFISKDDYEDMKYLLEKYNNLILQGPPGVGKTFLAKRLADSLIGCRYSSHVEMVQFHQSYSYEDFFMGYKPTEEGFEIIEGPFYKFCKEAEKCPTGDFYFIIDEINRGDLSKIFGELFMLIEDDKRGEDYKIKLLYRDEYFYVPENVYIIGLMNTADRSIAMVDWALRRRFSFFDLKPGFDSENFKKYQEKINNPTFNEVIRQIKSLNETISSDDTLGEGFCIGHSYFCNLEDSEDIEKDLRLIINFKILPLLKEYWFDEEDNDNIEKLETLSNSLKTEKSEGG